ncbi:MAG: hypothetical protein QM504_09770 [Pseudomonadota bacterium]
MTENMAQLPCHGVLFKYCDTGVFLTGASGIGKSDLMLQLLQWGAQLVCDDAPRFSVQTLEGEKKVIGCCDDAFSGMLHIRDLGLIDMASIFNHDVISASVSLQLIIHLSKEPDNQHYLSPLLSPEYELINYQQITLHRLKLPYNAERPMALLVKTAVKQYCLKLQHRGCCELYFEKELKNS